MIMFFCPPKILGEDTAAAPWRGFGAVLCLLCFPNQLLRHVGPTPPLVLALPLLLFAFGVALPLGDLDRLRFG